MSILTNNSDDVNDVFECISCGPEKECSECDLYISLEEQLSKELGGQDAYI